MFSTFLAENNNAIVFRRSKSIKKHYNFYICIVRGKKWPFLTHCSLRNTINQILWWIKRQKNGLIIEVADNRICLCSRSCSDNTSKESLFSFLTSFLMLQPVASVLFMIYISCYPPMTNASLVLANLQSRFLFPPLKKTMRIPRRCLHSNYLE